MVDYGMFDDKEEVFKEQIKEINGYYDGYLFWMIIAFIIFCILTK